MSLSVCVCVWVCVLGAGEDFGHVDVFASVTNMINAVGIFLTGLLFGVHKTISD